VLCPAQHSLMILQHRALRGPETHCRGSNKAAIGHHAVDARHVPAGGFDSDFSNLLRYLAVTSRSFHAMRDRGGHRCGGACALASQLLLPERAARPLPPDTSGTFPEATVQALSQVRVASFSRTSTRQLRFSAMRLPASLQWASRRCIPRLAAPSLE